MCAYAMIDSSKYCQKTITKTSTENVTHIKITYAPVCVKTGYTYTTLQFPSELKCVYSQVPPITVNVISVTEATTSQPSHSWSILLLPIPPANREKVNSVVIHQMPTMLMHYLHTQLGFLAFGCKNRWVVAQTKKSNHYVVYN